MFLTFPPLLQIYTSIHSQLVLHWIKNNPSTNVLVFHFYPVGLLVHVADIIFFSQKVRLCLMMRKSHMLSLRKEKGRICTLSLIFILLTPNGLPYLVKTFLTFQTVGNNIQHPNCIILKSILLTTAE